jgi:hypothetical protein
MSIFPKIVAQLSLQAKNSAINWFIYFFIQLIFMSMAYC